MKIALAGNPNCGKTTLFNALTGSNQFVGNWPGVTVEKKEGNLEKDITLVDLPGIYSLSPYSLEEIVARDYLTKDRPQAILNIVDGTNLERNLYLTTQLAELNIPMVVAVNMMDVVKKNKDKIDLDGLSEAFGCPFVEISALKKTGINQSANMAIRMAEKGTLPTFKNIFSEGTNTIINDITAKLQNIPENQKRWYAIKIFEGDDAVINDIPPDNQIQDEITEYEKKADDDAKSIITSERYTYISHVTAQCTTRKQRGALTLTDKIDRVVTNRWLALPIFAAVMFFVYFVAVTTIGAWATDFTNDTLFGEIIYPSTQIFLINVSAAPWLQGLILDGIIGGVGAVLGFVPQMLILFALLAFLEACGYMSRIAFIMDRIFRKFGLSGKSFIPILIGTGCGIPGIMASRTIENECDRKMTVITTTFIPCGAKLPIIALIAGALFGGAWWVAPSAYFVGIAAIIVSGIILKKTKLFFGKPSPFVMELPTYHMPTPSNILRSMWERGYSFIKKAGTIILLSAIVIWFISNFGYIDGQIQMTDDLSNGFLAGIGGFIAPIFAPLGWGNWQATVSTITGLVAKESVVGTLGVLYGFGEVAENGMEIWSALSISFTAIAAYSFLLFNLLCAPCFAAIGAIKQEMQSSKWTWFAIGYQTLFAYVIALCFYQIGNFFLTGSFQIFTAVAFIFVALIIFLLIKPNKKRSLIPATNAA